MIGLYLNVNKCKIMTFDRTNNFIKYDYCFDNVLMSRVTIVKDLGFVSTPSLSCIIHIDTIFSKAMCILGFIRWSVTNFISPCFNSIVQHIN